jgi:hypothetical protein
VPDLAALNVTGQKTLAGYQLTGVVRNFGPGTYVTGRTFRFERWNGSAWVVLVPSQPLNGPLPSGAVKQVFANLGAAPALGTQIRLHLSAGDAQPGNDISPLFLVVAPDLAAQAASGQTTAAGYLLKGTVQNNGPGAYTGGRSFRFEKLVGVNWVALTPAVPLAGPIAASASQPVQSVLAVVPPAGTKVRLHITPGDAQVVNDNSVAFTVVLPDLQAQNVHGHQTAAGYLLNGQIHNNGPGVYAGGRSFRFDKKVGANWVPLTALQPVPGPILAGATKAVVVTVPGTLPEGTLVRLHVTPGDAVVGNDNAQATLHAPDLRAVSGSAVGLTLHGTIHNNGPGVYTGGRTFRFEKKVGANWVPLTAFAPIPGGSLGAGGNRAVTGSLAVALPAGTHVRLHLSPGDANTANDNSP